MNNTLKTIILVVVLAVAGYFLLPYVKTNQNPQNGQNNQTSGDQSNSGSSDSGDKVTAGNIQTYTSEDFGANFKYAKDQDGDGKDDTDVKQSGDKIYVYYTASPAEQGQWVQKFSKDPNLSLADAVKGKFLQGISEQDCFTTSMDDFYSKYGVQAPPLPANTERIIIAYPFPTDEAAPFDQNAGKCPQGYSLTNGLSYFQMDKTHPDKFYFFSIGQYPIIADSNGQTTWQDTFQVTK